jgi:apolipoprotein N-acyltransferase
MRTQAIAYSRLSRFAAAALTVISRGGLLVLVVLLVFVPNVGLANQLRLMRGFAAVFLVPAIVAWLLERACTATVLIDGGTLVLERRGARIEIPCAAIDRVTPWWVPLPSSGVWLRLKSGRRVRYGLQLHDPIGFIEAIAGAGAPEHVRAASRRRAVVYARAKHVQPPRWYHPLLKFVVFALVPTLPLFRLNQWIAYGGTFGEYYTYGLQAYLLGFAIYWATLTIYLVLYAAVLRVVTEAIVLPATWILPSRAAMVRRAVEIGNRILYYGAVLAFLVRLYLQSE